MDENRHDADVDEVAELRRVVAAQAEAIKRLAEEIKALHRRMAEHERRPGPQRPPVSN